MATRQRTDQEAAAGTAAESPPAPQFYIAKTALYLTGEFGRARAFNAGDKVPPGHVEAFGWRDLVRLPDEPAPEPPEFESWEATGTLPELRPPAPTQTVAAEPDGGDAPDTGTGEGQSDQETASGDAAKED